MFLRASRAFAALAAKKLEQRDHEGLGATHTALLPHPDLEGTRVTALAGWAGMPEQAAGQVVRGLERRGYVERRPDPADSRATLVSFTDAGWRFLRDAGDVKRGIEEEYGVILGESGCDCCTRPSTSWSNTSRVETRNPWSRPYGDGA